MRQSLVKALHAEFRHLFKNPTKRNGGGLSNITPPCRSGGGMSLTMKKKDTQRQKKLVKLISENLGTGKKTKTMYEMMLEAGYKESTALQQSTILTRIYDKVVPIVQRLEAERDRILDALTKKNLRWEKYKDLVESLDKLTKNIQLLSGKPTEIHDDYRQLSDDELRRLSKGAGGARKTGTGA